VEEPPKFTRTWVRGKEKVGFVLGEDDEVLSFYTWACNISRAKEMTNEVLLTLTDMEKPARISSTIN
jgi:hypothetical protein